MRGRHYVTLGAHRWRNFLVVRTDSILNRYTYTTVSRHWTWKAANKAAHALNKQEGHSI